MIRNVVIVNDFDYVQGGASKVAIQTANLLVEHTNLNIYFFCGTFDHPCELDERVHKVKINSQDALKNSNRLSGIIDGIYNCTAKRELTNLLLSLNSEETIVHIHGWTKVLSSSVFKACFDLKVKTVLTMHDYFSVCPNGGFYNFCTHEKCYYKPMTSKCIRCNCDSRNYFFKIYRLVRQFAQNKLVKLPNNLRNIIYISNFSEKLVESYFNGITNRFLIYNPVEIINSNNKKIEQLNYYLFVGRVCYEKGVDLFCSVMNELKLPAIVVGDGPLLNELRNEYEQILFCGWKKEDEVNLYMRNAKALIFTSDWYETMGLTVVEAQLNGIPVFVKNNTAAVEFTNYPNFVYSNRSELINILKQYENEIVKPEKKINEEKFNSEEYVKKIISAYEDCN